MLFHLLELLMFPALSAGLIIGGLITYLLGVRDPFLIAFGACVAGAAAVVFFHPPWTRERKVRGSR